MHRLESSNNIRFLGEEAGVQMVQNWQGMYLTSAICKRKEAYINFNNVGLYSLLA
jgi:hypothetical protein